MKNAAKVTALAIFILLTQLCYGQDTPEAPKEPKEPYNIEVPEFEIDFQNFNNLSEKEEKELLKNLKKDLREELKIIKNVNKERYFDFLRESQFKNIRVPFIAKREKLMIEKENKIFELEVKTEALAAKYKKANESNRKNIKNQLKQELEKLFKEKEERRKQEVEELEEELKELKKSLAVRQQNKDKIIERRMQELLDEDEYLEWD
jgi:UDP:flavonoid glycosyltransferase YjiC (YdhE family)